MTGVVAATTASEQLLDLDDIDRLDEMAIETCTAGFEPVGFLPPAAQRDE